MCGFNLSQNFGRLARMNHPHQGSKAKVPSMKSAEFEEP